MSKIPQYFENPDPPLICYQYKKPIRNIIFNYNKVTSDPNILESAPTSCECNSSKFVYEPAGHIITGDLNIISDKYLRSLFTKGPKYRIPSRIDFDKCRDVVEEALQNFCKRWSKKEGVKVYALNEWMKEILEIIDIRIENFSKNPHLFRQPKGHSVRSIQNKLRLLHNKFVFAPADKAANNIIII